MEYQQLHNFSIRSKTEKIWIRWRPTLLEPWFYKMTQQQQTQITINKEQRVWLCIPPVQKVVWSSSIAVEAISHSSLWYNVLRLNKLLTYLSNLVRKDKQHLASYRADNNILSLSCSIRLPLQIIISHSCSSCLRRISCKLVVDCSVTPTLTINYSSLRWQQQMMTIWQRRW